MREYTKREKDAIISAVYKGFYGYEFTTENINTIADLMIEWGVREINPSTNILVDFRELAKKAIGFEDEGYGCGDSVVYI